MNCLFILACLGLLATMFVAEVQSDDVRLALFDWASEWDYDTNSKGPFFSEDDGGETQVYEAQFYIAAQAFNERNADLLPVLGTLGSCNKNISVPWFCDTGGNSRVAFSDMLELAQLAQPPHAIIGPARSPEATSMGMASSVLGNIPILSHWATSPRMADRNLFPYFMRTVPSDYASVIVLNRLFRQFNWKRAYLIFEAGDFGAGWKDALFSEMSKDNGTLKFSAYNFDDYPSILSACGSAYASKINVIVFIGSTDQVLKLANAWKESGLSENKPVMILATLDSVSDPLSLALESETVASMVHASLAFSVSIAENSRWTAYKQKWAEGYFTKYESFVNESFLPNGLANTNQGCANSNDSYPLMDGLLGPESLSMVLDVWTWAFDAVITVGLATCQLYPEDPLPPTFTNELYDAMVNVRFEGLSGKVQFDNTTGDRDPLTSGFTLVNFRRPNSANNVVESLVVGNWDAAAEKWAFPDLNTITFPLGQGLANAPDVLVPVHERNPLPMGWKIWGYAEVAILNALCVFCLIWLYLHRGDKMIINAQGTFLMVMVIGCMIASWSILALTADDAPDDSLNETFACNAAFMLFGFGFQLALLALIVKVYRIYFIFKASNKLRTRGYKTVPLLGIVALIMCVESIILIVWVTAAPLYWERTVTQRDEFGNPMVSSGMCAGGPASVALMCVVFGFHALSLVLTSVASNQVRDLPAQYQESKYVNLAIFSMLQIFLVSVPAVVASYQEVVGRFVIMTSVVFVIVGALILFLVMPKVFPNFFEMHTDEIHSTPAAAGHSSKRVVQATSAKHPAVRGGGAAETADSLAPATSNALTGHVLTSHADD